MRVICKLTLSIRITLERTLFTDHKKHPLYRCVLSFKHNFYLFGRAEAGQNTVPQACWRDVETKAGKAGPVPPKLGHLVTLDSVSLQLLRHHLLPFWDHRLSVHTFQTLRRNVTLRLQVS